MRDKEWDRMWDEQIARKHAEWESWMFDGRNSPHEPVKQQRTYSAPRKTTFTDAPATKKPSILDEIKRVRDMSNQPTNKGDPK